VSAGVCDAFGIPPVSSFGYHAASTTPQLGDSPSRSLSEKGIAYSKDKSQHKKIFHVTDSTGGRASPAGARLAGREETTTGEAYRMARLEALAAGRAHTSMLP
jgi:hypothetical protein